MMTTLRTRRTDRRTGRSRAGFSLTEMLAVFLILALVGTAVANGVPAAQRAYEAATDAANAQVLLSNSTTRLRHVLSVAKPETVAYGAEDAKKAALDAKGRALKADQEAATRSGSSSTYEGAYNPDDALVVFESYATGYTTILLKDDQRGLLVAEENTHGKSPENGNAVALVPASGTSGLHAAVRTEVDGIEYSNGCFTITGLRVLRDSTEVSFAKVDGPLLVNVFASHNGIAVDGGERG